MNKNEKAIAAFAAYVNLPIEVVEAALRGNGDDGTAIRAAHMKWFMARERRNAEKRARNQILRDVCGTSARAAREDMGM